MFVDFVTSRSKIACGFSIYTVVINSAYCKSHFCTMNEIKTDGVSSVSSPSSVQSTPEIEKKYVHRVYDAIAPHFSSTRFAKWPKVATFLNSLPLGSLVLDAGCGNGKYLGLNPNCFFIGCDISAPLISICGDRGHEVVVADAVNLPYRTGYGDAAISIAVLHHLSTANRRKKAIDELIRVVKKGGLVLITVWAVEQEDRSLLNKWTPLTDKYSEEWIGPSSPAIRSTSSSTLESIPESEKYSSEWIGPSGPAIRSPSSSTLESIPESEKYSSEWIGPNGPAIRSPSSSTLESIPEGEKYSSEWMGPSSPAIRSPSSSTLESIPESEKYSSEWIGPSSPAIRNPSSSTLESIPESEENGLGERLRDFRGNMNLPETMQLNSQSKDHLTSSENGKKGENQQEFFVPWHLPYHRAEVGGASSCAIANGLAKKDDKKGAVVYNRYYHVFSEGELERLVSGMENAAVVDRFYDKSNWCIILEKTL